MRVVSLTGMVKIELPSRTLRLCDGGFFSFENENYRSYDDVFGTIGTVETMGEGTGDTVPAMTMTLLPPDTSGPIELSQAGNQTSRVRFIIAEYDAESGEIISGRTEFDGQLDQTVLKIARGQKEIAASVVSLMERMFEGNIGNTLNSEWHKSIWPGETGHDNATGLAVKIAWGTEKPNSSIGGGGGRSGSGAVRNIRNHWLH